MMKVSIYGTGYVGLVTGACLAQIGHDVVCADIDSDKIQRLKHNEIPIYEPGLKELVQRNVIRKRLQFTDDNQIAVDHGLLQFITVNTPTRDQGGADISNVLAVAKTIANHMQQYKLIINKSTAPVGTTAKIREVVSKTLNNRDDITEESMIACDVATNPEFLKEGSAIEDFMYGERIIIGTDNINAKELLEDLYLPLIHSGIPLLNMRPESAELSKYAANAMLATRISFINEIANIAEPLGANIDEVCSGIGTDPRIGKQFINPGIGYGGSCFPKDIKALIHTIQQHDQPALVLSAVEKVNTQQKYVLVNKLANYFNNQLKDKTIAIWGLAFKPDTDDIREAPSRVIINKLLSAGAKIQAYDPEAMAAMKQVLGQQTGLIFCDHKEDCLEGADALLICTEWQEFKVAKPKKIKQRLKQAIVFDGRNIYDPGLMHELGFKYFSIGR